VLAAEENKCSLSVSFITTAKVLQKRIPAVGDLGLFPPSAPYLLSEGLRGDVILFSVL